MKDRDLRWLDRPGNVTRLYRGLCALAAALFALDWIVHRHEDLSLATAHGFYALYGFFACVLLVLVAKGLRRVVKRPEDYYER